MNIDKLLVILASDQMMQMNMIFGLVELWLLFYAILTYWILGLLDLVDYHGL